MSHLSTSVTPPLYLKRAQGMGKKRCGTAFSSGVFLREKWHFSSFLHYIFILASLCSLWLHVSVWERKYSVWCDTDFFFVLYGLLQNKILIQAPEFNASPTLCHIFLKLDHKRFSVTWFILLLFWHKAVLVEADGSSRKRSCRWNHLQKLLYKSQLAFM